VKILKGVPFGATKVDCGSCTLCCKGQIITLDPEMGDDISRNDWDWKSHDLQRVRIMKLNNSGSCVHLTESGCDIYSRRPFICKVFDCREAWRFMKRRSRISKGR
jgi:Fe-S-cluster containining protein